jgi:hypothetical protein
MAPKRYAQALRPAAGRARVRFLYDEVQGRAVHVASQGIIKALRTVYKANRILAELGF